MNKDIEETNKRIEDMAKCCTYHINGVCFVNLTDPAECDLMCEMHGVFALLDLARYRKQKVGRWCTVNITACCSCCGFVRNIKKQIGWNFCPNCGAKMEGDKNDAR